MDKPGTFPQGHSLNTSHGHTWKGGYSPTYGSWQSMKQRCKPGGKYHAKGIPACSEWVESFPAFLAHMGERPAGTTLDRIDGTRGYEPGNCRWATTAVQQANKTVIGTRPCAEGCTCGRHTSKPRSEETRDKIREAKMGHEVTQETRDKISATKRARAIPGARVCAEGCTCGKHTSWARR